MSKAVANEAEASEQAEMERAEAKLATPHATPASWQSDPSGSIVSNSAGPRSWRRLVRPTRCFVVLLACLLLAAFGGVVPYIYNANGRPWRRRKEHFGDWL